MQATGCFLTPTKQVEKTKALCMSPNYLGVVVNNLLLVPCWRVWFMALVARYYLLTIDVFWLHCCDCDRSVAIRRVLRFWISRNSIKSTNKTYFQSIDFLWCSSFSTFICVRLRVWMFQFRKISRDDTELPHGKSNPLQTDLQHGRPPCMKILTNIRINSARLIPLMSICKVSGNSIRLKQKKHLLGKNSEWNINWAVFAQALFQKSVG